MCSVRKENLDPKRSPEINTYVRARGAPWMSGFWTPAGVLLAGRSLLHELFDERVDITLLAGRSLLHDLTI